ncbi:MAG: sensor histidine kinase [Synergistaceae bacterium]|jgi:signal transduction histidine kinase|nr:sensor histidine kinase [Synergistaceae bacterium]
MSPMSPVNPTGKENTAGGRRRNRKLLSVLFILVVVPVVLLLVRSTVTMTTQRRMVLEISSGYARQLARHAATRFNERDDVRMRDFLELLSDRGYERALRRDTPRGPERREDRVRFLPGMLACVRRDGTIVMGSARAEVLTELRLRHPELEESIVDTMTVNGQEMAYCLYACPTDDPDVVAVAAVTMFSWMGGNGFFMARFVNETMLVTLFCLVVLILLRMVLIRPLRALSSGLRTFAWGREIPKFDPREGQLFGMQVEEIASLRDAIDELAKEAVQKTELENRYLGDIVKAQEEERNHLAREIHDGPIQVVAALMQRIQMASLSLEEIKEEMKKPGERDVRDQLALAEEAAQNVVEDLRGICDSLVPPWMSLGLARCLEEAGARLARQHDVTIEVDVDLAVEPSPERTLALFRIFQEGVSNAVRHGRATRIELSVAQTADRLTFVLRDDGTGFDSGAVNPDDLRASGKRGLSGMRQRVESFGGTWSVRSEQGGGTTVEATLREESQTP